MLSFDQTVAGEVLNARYHVLELAALLDRLDEAAKREGRASAADVRLKPLFEALAVVAGKSDRPDRAERILRLYTNPE